MKKIILLFFLSAQILIITAQSYTIDLQAVSVAEMDFAPFIFSNDLSGAPRIFAVTITPEEGIVKLRGEIFWKKNPNSNFEWLLTFRTKTFEARTLFNTDLGNTIRLDKIDSNGDLIEDTRKKGKPTGEYNLRVYLLDENNNELAFDSWTYEFSNPSQTITILSPRQSSLQDIGSVLAEWTELNGIEYYQVRANNKTETGQSSEDALESGEPVINDVQVGLRTSIDLRTILTREWLPGQEIILQVSALPTGGAPSDIIKSDIISFYLDDPTNPTVKVASENLLNLLQSLKDGLGNDLLEKLINGDVIISEIQWEETGLSLTPEEIQELMDYLKKHPDNLIKIEQD